MRLPRKLNIGLKCAAIAGGSLFLSGAAFADATSPAVTNESQSIVVIAPSDLVQTSTVSQVISSISDNQTSATDLRTVPNTDTQITAAADAPIFGSSSTKVVTADTLVMSSSPVGSANDLPNLTTQQPEQAHQVMPIWNTIARVMPFRSFQFQNKATSDAALGAELSSIPAASIPISPYRAPVQPIGAFGALVALFANALPARAQIDATLTTSSIAFAFIIMFLALPLNSLRRFAEISYGAWLKLTGFLSEMVAELPAPFSIFGTPFVSSYVCAPAPYA